MESNNIFLKIIFSILLLQELQTNLVNGSPYFGTFSKFVSIYEGQTANMHCIIHNQDGRSVTWLRKKDLHIITVDRITYTADNRFKALHQPETNEWMLVIQYVQPRDSGVYECQVNTDPKISRHVKLTVIENSQKPDSKTKVFVANNTASTKDGNLIVELVGTRERFIEEGSKLNLTCVIVSSIGPTSVIYWYHGNTIIDYNSPRGGVSLEVNETTGKTITTLTIFSVGPGDSGMYSCVPIGSHPASVLVHVQKEEQKAAIYQSGVNSSNSGSTLQFTSTNKWKQCPSVFFQLATTIIMAAVSATISSDKCC